MSKIAGSSKNREEFSFRLTENDIKSKFSFKGIEFSFSDYGYLEFVGFDVVDINFITE
ncbi:hypothetical protein [Peribacillus frigoritolerans]|uniref:hypothetical protein n=1 Tax=Peribacillus frigoritolerans TaxID=450367 RepID=UPI0013A5DC86|nr:hypothetical protein [Peribacillus frigoritolerans]